MRKLVLMVCQCLLLAGCTGLPRPREMGEMALVRTVGVDGGLGALTLTVSTGEGAADAGGDKTGALILSGEGPSLTAAALELRGRGDKYVFYGYADQLLLGEGADLLTALGWLSQDDELGLGANTWLVREGSARDSLEGAGESGGEGRLTALAMDGKLGAAPVSRSAGEVYIALLERDCAFVPALRGADLTPAGYAVVRGEQVVGYLEDSAARGLELLVEQPSAQVLEVELLRSRVSAQVTGAQLDCRPHFQGEELTRLELTARVGVELRQWERTPTAGEREEMAQIIAGRLELEMERAVEQLQSWGTDCVGLGSRVSLAAPWHWAGLEEDWPRVFSAADYEIKVEVSLG